MSFKETGYRLFKMALIIGLAYFCEVYGHERLALAVILAGALWPDPDFSGRMRGEMTEVSAREAKMTLFLNKRQRDWIAGIAGIRLSDAIVRLRGLRGFGNDDVQLTIQLLIKPTGQDDFYNITSENPLAMMPTDGLEDLDE